MIFNFSRRPTPTHIDNKFFLPGQNRRAFQATVSRVSQSDGCFWLYGSWSQKVCVHLSVSSEPARAGGGVAKRKIYGPDIRFQTGELLYAI